MIDWIANLGISMENDFSIVLKIFYICHCFLCELRSDVFVGLTAVFYSMLVYFAFCLRCVVAKSLKVFFHTTGSQRMNNNLI